MTTTLPDLRPLLGRALDQAGQLIDTTAADQGSLPTPCPDFDVATLIGHLLGVTRRIGVVLDGRPFHEAPSELDSTDWAGDWAAGRAATDEILAVDANLERIVTVPWGQVPGAAAVGSYVGEITVHAWDLAVATGRSGELDDELAEVSLQAYQQFVAAEPRGGEIPFGAVVPVPDDAPAYHRLVAWVGRDPQWGA